MAFGVDDLEQLVNDGDNAVGTGCWASGYVEFEVGPPENDGGS
jgi:hypothetical protein